MKLRHLIILLALGTARAELIPAIRLTDWTPGTKTGVIGGIPNRTSPVIDVTAAPYNADKTGANDATTPIQNAINAAASGSVVFLPAGTYRLNGGLNLNNNVTVRGSGMTTTTLMAYNAVTYRINFGSGSSNWSTMQLGLQVTGGLTKGSTTLTMADTSTIPVNTMVKIARTNGTDQFAEPLVAGVGAYTDNFNYLMVHLLMVTAKTSTTLTVFPPLNNTYVATGQLTRIQPSGYATTTNKVGAGLEDLTLDIINGTTTFGVTLQECSNSWIKGVRILNLGNYGVMLANTLNCEMRECYIGKSKLTGSNNAGILMGGCTNTLVEDNIILDNQPGIEANANAGCVVAYNFFYSPTTYALTIDSNHGAHGSANLYEGNIANHHESDGYFGSEGYLTMFRNWYTGLDSSYPPGTPGTLFSIDFMVALKRFTHHASLVGNILGMNNGPYTYTAAYDGVSLGYPNIGNGESSGFAPPWATAFGAGTGPGDFQERDNAVASTLVRKGNWVGYTVSQESLGGDTLPNSLFRTSKPAFFGALTWPPVNPSVNPGNLSRNEVFSKIPAGYRYVNGVGVPPSGPDTTPPNVSSAAINTAGTQISLTFDEAVQIGSGGNNGFTLTASGGSVTATLPSSFSGGVMTLTMSRTINSSETVTRSYTQPSNGIEDLAGNDLASFTNQAVTNNSTVGGGPPPGGGGTITVEDVNVQNLRIVP
jgi:Pectate lyase superfamily protein/Putative flagellar system-associated repeat/Right handed beta helix region